MSMQSGPVVPIWLVSLWFSFRHRFCVAVAGWPPQATFSGLGFLFCDGDGTGALSWLVLVNIRFRAATAGCFGAVVPAASLHNIDERAPVPVVFVLAGVGG